MSCTCVNGAFECSGSPCPPTEPPCPASEPPSGASCGFAAQQCAYVDEQTACGADICTCNTNGPASSVGFWTCAPSCVEDAGEPEEASAVVDASFGE